MDQQELLAEAKKITSNQPNDPFLQHLFFACQFNPQQVVITESLIRGKIKYVD